MQSAAGQMYRQINIKKKKEYNMIGSGKTKIVEFGSKGLTGVVSQCDRRLPACSDFRPATSRSYNGRCLHYSYVRWTWLLPLLARRSGIMPVRNSPRDPDSGTNSLQELFTFSSYCRALLLAVLDPRVAALWTRSSGGASRCFVSVNIHCVSKNMRLHFRR